MLVGGVAANLHGSVRATKDVDVLVPKDSENMTRLLVALSKLPLGIASELDAEEIMGKPITIIGDDPRVDVMTVAWNLTFERANRSKLVRRIAGIRVPYVGLADLRRSKRTGRPADTADLEALRGTSRTRRPRAR